MAPVIEVSREELLSRRGAVLRHIEMDEEEFERVRETRTLSSEEWLAKEELDEIAFLLGSND